MDSQQQPQPGQADQESIEQARARFWHNYQALGGQDRSWFDEAVKPLLLIAVPGPGQPQPWYLSITPVLAPPAPPAPPRRQAVREKILLVSLARLGGIRESVGLAG